MTRTTDDKQRARTKAQQKDVFVVDAADDGTPRFTKIGVATATADGHWALRLSAVPLPGNKMQILPKDDEAQR
jgi:hypothetical protein